MAKNFSATVDAWARKSKERQLAVFRTSVERTIEDAQKPKGDGGNMPIDTGFLRASGQTSLSGMPQGPTRKTEGFPAPNANLVIASAQIGDKIFFGWTAAYARVREYHDGFLRSAVQKWRTTVADVVAEAKRRFP